MAFPTEGWPPPPPSGRRSIRFYKTDTATANFDDKAYLFIDGAGANTFVPLPYVAPGSTATVTLGSSPYGTGRSVQDASANGNIAVPKAPIWSGNIRICNDGGGALEYSFDGTNVAGKLLANESVVYLNRYEAGICVRGAAAVFRIEAW